VDIFEQLEQKLMGTIEHLEGLQKEKKDWLQEQEAQQEKIAYLAQQLAEVRSALIERDAEKLRLEQEIQQLSDDNSLLTKDNVRLSQENNESAAKAESLLEILQLADVS